MSADWIVFNSKTGFKMKYFTFNSQMSGCDIILVVWQISLKGFLAKYIYLFCKRLSEHCSGSLLCYICAYDKRTNTGFKGQSSVAEEASLTSKPDSKLFI